MNIAISEAASLALHALAELARQQDAAPTTTAKIAEHFGFSEAHLSKVFQRLAKAGLVKSERGPKGGFSLTRDPASITLMEIYEAIDGPLSRGSGCLLERSPCAFDGCIFGDLLLSVPARIGEYFASTSLADVAKSH